MKKIIFIFLVLFSFVLIGCSSSDKFTVTFNTDGGTLIESVEVNKGEKVDEPVAPTKEGFNFDGWYLNDVLFNFDTVIDGDITLNAKWISNAVSETFTVIFYDNDDNVISEQQISKGKAAVAPQLEPIRGLEFVGWTEEFDNVTKDLYLYPLYEEVEILYIVTFDSLIGDEHEPMLFAPDEIVSGLPTYNSQSDSSMKFIGWFYEDTQLKRGMKYRFEDDINVVAKWEYEVQLVYSEEYVIDYELNSVENTLPKDKYDNLVVLNWYDNPELEGDPIDVAGIEFADKKIYAETRKEGLSAKEKEAIIDNVIDDLIAQLDGKTFTENIELKTSYNDVSATWTSSRPTVVSNEGVVSLEAKNARVELTAELTYLEYTKTVSVVITIGGSGMKDISKTVVASYVYNGTYRRNKVNDFMLDTVDVIYASFVLPNADGTLHVSDSYLTAINDYKTKAQAKGVRVVLCIGQEGAGYCKNFSIIANDNKLRAKFVSNVVKMINEYGFDGVDIDWEYPGYNTGVDVSIDKLAYTQLMKDLYTAVKANDENHLVTSAIPAGPWGYVRFNLAESIKYLDYINLMSYDLQCSEDGGLTYHHCALYKSNYTFNTCSVEESVNLFVTQGVPKEKLIIGAAFYGRYSTVLSSGKSNGLGATIGTYNGKTNIGTTIRYSDIRTDYLNHQSDTIKCYFDDVAKAPYIFDSKNNIFITYEDPTSIGYKCDYVISKGVAGIMYWDNGSDDTGELIGAINSKLNVLK